MKSFADGFLILDKPPGWTSQQAVHRLKRLFGWDKSGHTGTLDPLATGVLPVAWGEATKVIPFLDESLKIYETEGKLGETTTTYDAEGSLTRQADFRGVGEADLGRALEGFHGDIQQSPPAFSAVKIQGKPAYRLARRGEDVALAPRNVKIHSLELLFFSPPCFGLRVSCGRGTYIRSLIHDLGEILGPGAHVSALRRIQSGPFRLDHALRWADLEADPSLLETKALSIEDSLGQLPQLALEAGEKSLVQCGNLPYRIEKILGAKSLKPGVWSLTEEGRILALTASKKEGNWKLERVLHRA